MSSLPLLEQAIRMRRTISFHYEKEGRRHGTRVGLPHALYRGRSGDLYCDVFQTSGATDDYTLPDWRQFSVSDMEYVEILGAEFQAAPGYNPDAEKYSDCIVQV